MEIQVEWANFWAAIIGAVIGAVITGFITIYISKKQSSLGAEIMIIPKITTKKGTKGYDKFFDYEFKIVNKGNVKGMFVYQGLYPHIDDPHWTQIRKNSSLLLYEKNALVLGFPDNLTEKDLDEFIAIDAKSMSDKKFSINRKFVNDQLSRNGFNGRHEKVDIVVSDVDKHAYRYTLEFDTQETIDQQN